MTITLAELVARLEADIPAVSGVPSAAQYAQAVKDAVADLSRRASVPRVSTLSVVAGQAAYTVPDDFQRLIRLAAIGAQYPLTPAGCLDWRYDYFGGVFVTPAGLVPFTGSGREQYTVTGDQLTIYPTPQTSADRDLVYAAGDAVSDDGLSYPTLTEDRAAIALLLASAMCMERQAAAGSSTAGKVSGLGYTIDGAQIGSGQRAGAAGLRDSYLAAIDSLNAAIGGLG